jgi:DNA-binding CsgD family transcriptional regulator
LLVDDVQWADRVSLRFLTYLAQRVSDLPVALFLAVRTGDPMSEPGLVAHLADTSGAGLLRPAELTRAGVLAFLREVQVDDRRDALTDAVWEATRGNLFLLHELVAVMRQGPDGIWDSDGKLEDLFATKTAVSRNVLLRLQRLGGHATELARACAVAGDDTSLAVAARLARLSLDAAAVAASLLVEADILRSADPVVFSHPITRSAVYAELPLHLRLQAHLAIAELLNASHAPADNVARHLLLATPVAERWVARALQAGAREAARKGAAESAVRYLRRALDITPVADRSAELLLELGIVEAETGNGSAFGRLQEALELATDPRAQSAALEALGQALYRHGRQHEAAAAFRQGARLFESADRDLWLRFEAAFTCAAQWVLPMRPTVAEHLGRLVETMPERQPRSYSERAILASYALFSTLTEPSSSVHTVLARRALGGGALLGEETSNGAAVHLAILALLWCGQPDEAEREVDAVLADARRRGAGPAFAEASVVRAMAMLAQGRLDEALADAQAAIDGIERGWTLTSPEPEAIAAFCLIERGELALAESVIASARLAAPETGNVGAIAWVLWIRGLLHLQREQPRDALEDMLAAGRALEPYGMINPALIPWRTGAATAAAALGRRDEAAALARETLELARDFELPVQMATGLRARALTERGAVACKSLEDAAGLLEGSSARLELAKTLEQLARAQRACGREAASRDLLRRAYELAGQCGAAVLERRLKEQLISAGARPRRSALTGVASLTARERRIAGMAAQGMSNRDIAEALFLTKNTVEWHLRNIYRKLNIAARAELRPLLSD